MEYFKLNIDVEHSENVCNSAMLCCLSIAKLCSCTYLAYLYVFLWIYSWFEDGRHRTWYVSLPDLFWIFGFGRADTFLEMDIIHFVPVSQFHDLAKSETILHFQWIVHAKLNLVQSMYSSIYTFQPIGLINFVIWWIMFVITFHSTTVMEWNNPKITNTFGMLA